MATSRPAKRSKLDSDSDDSDAVKVPAVKKSHGGGATASSTQYSSSGSSSESDDEWTVGGKVHSKKGRKGRPTLGRQSGKRMAGWSKGGKRSSGATSSDEDSDDFTLNKVTRRQSSSLTSDSEDEEESGSDESLQFDDGLGEDLVGDEEDMRKLNEMTEAERELELFKRHEQREALKARFEIERKLIQEKKQLQKKKKKRREESQLKSRRISLRTKDRRYGKEDKTTKAMDELKAKRTADKQRKAAEAEQQQHRREPLKASEVFSNSSEESTSDSSDDEGDTSGDETGEKSGAGSKVVDSRPITTLDQLNRIKLSRFRLEKWVHMPFFADVVKGCYVRLGIGQHEGRMVYRVCEILAVQETPKIYIFGGSRTNKGLKVKHGLQERVFRMEYVSNSPFSEGEFSKWKSELLAKGISLPTVHFVESKTREIDSKKRFVLKDDDIDKIIIEKQKFQKNPHNYALTKSRLMREKEVADTEGDTDKVSILAKQLEELEERAEELDRQRSKGLSAISYINERNRQRNVARAEMALKEEMALIKEREEDPFTRRKCNPRLVTFAKDSLGNAGMIDVSLTKSKESMTAPTATETPSRNNGADAAKPSVEVTPTISATPVLESKPDVKDLFSAHDFDIQIDLPSSPQGQSDVKITPKVTPPAKTDGPRRSLNLSDYKKRRGLI